jgi:hypothetical protein
VRFALAIFLATFVLLGAAAPHEHGSALGTHACAACVTAGAEEARGETPDVSPRPHAAAAARDAYMPLIARGAPLGAIPGQSPPAAS